MCRLLIDGYGAKALGGKSMVGWLEHNWSRSSSNLLEALVETRPELFELARDAWAAEIAPPAALAAWGKDEGVAGGSVAGAKVNYEDELGPPWVEPNRHCTLMFYLNEPDTG